LKSLWHSIFDLMSSREEAFAQKLSKDPVYLSAQKKVEDLLSNLDSSIATQLDNAFTGEQAIYQKEIYLAGLRDGFKLSKVLNGDITMLQLFREKEEDAPADQSVSTL